MIVLIRFLLMISFSLAFAISSDKVFQISNINEKTTKIFFEAPEIEISRDVFTVLNLSPIKTQRVQSQTHHQYLQI